jgi:beta-mannosidase
MSEFGFQALPPLATIRTFAEEADWNMTSYIMEQHQRNSSGNALIVSQMLDAFRLPKDFDSLVYLSMVLQAEGIRYGVEHWRRHTNRVSGTLYWQLNDCWPVASWSSIDYFGRWKALHYAARRFYAPLMMSIEDAPPHQTVFLTNDTRESWQGTVRWALTNLDGEIIQSGEQPAHVEPFAVVQVCALEFAQYVTDDNCRKLVFTASLWQDDRRQALAAAYFAPTKHLELIDPKISAEIHLFDGQLKIDLESSSLARMLECSLEEVDVIFSDNYFDLPAQTRVTIFAPLPAGWTLAQAREAFKVRSVFNSFA